MNKYQHQAVLLEEAVSSLNIREEGIYLDGTFGRGGHSRAIMSRLTEQGRLFTLDKDPQAVAAGMEEWGDDIDSYDLIIALSPASQRRALEYTRVHALEVEYWPIFDPTGLGNSREDKLNVYRQTRDQISQNIIARFGPPDEIED